MLQKHQHNVSNTLLGICVTALTLIGCEPQEKQTASATPKQIVEPAQDTVSEQQTAFQPQPEVNTIETPSEDSPEKQDVTDDSAAPDEPSTQDEQSEPEEIPPPAPEPLPVLVKAGGAIEPPSQEELHAAEKQKYAVPSNGKHPLTRNLYGGITVELPDRLYKQLEDINAKLREKLSPLDYAQILIGERCWWESKQKKPTEEYSGGKYGYKIDADGELDTVEKLITLLHKILQTPDDRNLFPRVQFIAPDKSGIIFRELPNNTTIQFHYGDEKVIAGVYTEGNEELSPNIRHLFWDARTEKLLCKTAHYACYVVPLRQRDDGFYTMWLTNSGSVEGNLISGGTYLVDSYLNPFTKEFLPGTWDLPPEEHEKGYFGNQDNFPPMVKASAADLLGIKFGLPNEGEGCLFPAETPQINYLEGNGATLVYRTAQHEEFSLNLQNLTMQRKKLPTTEEIDTTHSQYTYRPAPESLISGPQGHTLPEDLEILKNYEKHAGKNYHKLKKELNWPLKINAVSENSLSAKETVLTAWYVGNGSDDTIAFTAYAPGLFAFDYDVSVLSDSVYTGVWHKGETWFFSVPEGTSRHHYNQLHEEVTGEGDLVPLQEVISATKHDKHLLSWHCPHLHATEPGQTENSATLIIGSTARVNRVRVHFDRKKVEYLESWKCVEDELSPLWLSDMRLLMIPASPHHYKIIRLPENAESEELGELYITKDDGFAIILKNGIYTGTPGCEAFLDFGDGRRVISLQTLAPWRNKPAEVLQTLGGQEDDIIALRQTTERWLSKQGFDPANMPPEPRLSELPVAEVEIPELFTNNSELRVRVTLKATAHDISRVDVRRDGVLIPQPHISANQASEGCAEVSVHIPLANGENHIEITPVDVNGISGESTKFRTIYRGIHEANLFVVALGVSDYDDDSLDLQYAAKDALDVAHAFEQCSGMKTRTLVLTDKNVKKNGLEDKIKAFLSATTVDDTVVFYVAGHGMLNEHLEYYYAPSDFNPNKIADTGISADAIMTCLQSATAHTRVLMLDTCHAGFLGEEGEEKMALAMGNLPPGVRAIQRRGMKVKKVAPHLNSIQRKRYIEEIFINGSTQRGISVLAGSAGAEFALESGEWKNGVFTAAIIQTLRYAPEADNNADGKLSIAEMFHKVEETVRKQTAGAQSPSVSLPEKRGKAPLINTIEHFFQQKQWDRVERMLKNGCRYTNFAFKDDGSGFLALEAAGPPASVWQALAENVRETALTTKHNFDIAQAIRAICSTASREIILELIRILPPKQTDDLLLHPAQLEAYAIEELLKKGADINNVDEYGNTVLMNSRTENIPVLLRYGADINARNRHRCTALSTAVSAGNYERIRLLLENGADPSIPDNNGQTGFDHHDPKVRTILVEYTEGTSNMTAEQIRELGADYAEARKGKKKDEKKAIQLYILAADKGDMKAQRWMGWRYRQGRGVPKDESKAYSYFIKAYRQGDNAAGEAIGMTAHQTSNSGNGIDISGWSASRVRELGVDFAEGRNGRPINEQTAIQLYIEAANRGDMKAQRWMGWRYRQGRGVPKDENRARMYFQKAAQQGDEAAAKALKM